MSHNFAELVEDVKRLSPEEEKELQELLEKYMIEERRQEIFENYQASLKELHEDKLVFSSDAHQLQELLSHD